MSNPSRREFLTTAAAGVATLAIPSTGTAGLHTSFGKAKSCVFINMVGGPSHIDTFDPKPNAPAEVRGPFKPIQTRVPGLHLSELFPQLADLTDKFSLIRSMHHTAPPIHECGFQLLNTGRLFRDGPEWPNMGAVVAHLLAGKSEPAPWHILPHAAISTGVSVSHGLGAGFLGRHGIAPKVDDSTIGTPQKFFGPCKPVKEFYDCLVFRSAVAEDQNVRFVTVNMFDTVFDAASWDCHADGGSLKTNLNDIRNQVAPSFDSGFAQMLFVSDYIGTLDSKLIVATGEFGRTPKLNSNGGRDHWAGAWTTLIAGGGVKGGRVIGSTDSQGTEPTDRPVTPQELVATIFHALGVPYDATLPGPDGKPVAVYPAKPVLELF